MKNMILILLGTIIMLATASNANAQGWDKNIAFIPAKNHAAFVSFITGYGYAGNVASDTASTIFKKATADTKLEKASLKALKANGKAFKIFKKIYNRNTPDASWSVGKDAITATFSKENVKTIVVYNNKGNWLHAITYYPADKTPQDISAIMDDTYPKDNVKLTIKVEEGDKEFYVVQLENKATLKKVAVYNGELNVIEEFTKSN